MQQNLNPVESEALGCSFKKPPFFEPLSKKHQNFLNAFTVRRFKRSKNIPYEGFLKLFKPLQKSPLFLFDAKMLFHQLIPSPGILFIKDSSILPKQGHLLL